MRDMHCRGCTATGEWIFGMPQKTITGECRIIDTTSIRLSSTLVADVSLGWSTGMYDVRGKLIYEGDILRGGGLSDMGVVVYDMALASYVVHDLGDGSLVPKRPLADVYRHAMIVGNEYERGLTAAQLRP